MIPRHSLPFGFGTVLSLLISSSSPGDLSCVEKFCADMLGVREAILIPSVRAGILMSIEAVRAPGTILVGPAYTCSTVHQALNLAGVPTRLVDSASASFLMSPDAIDVASEPDCVLVLSQLYGLAYDDEMLKTGSRKTPRLRILDMAMNIPSAERVGKLEDRDVALFSFGWGKPMFAGRGGLACCQDVELAARIRALRNRAEVPQSLALRIRQNSSLFLHVGMNQRKFYGLSHERHVYDIYQNMMIGQRNPLRPIPGRAQQGLSPEWTQPMTKLSLELALHNFCGAPLNAKLRKSQAEIYSNCLVESGLVRGPKGGALPQSHFPVRLPADLRDKMGSYLRGCRIDTSTLFPVPPTISGDCYPNASTAAAEVIALPLGPGISLDEVWMISNRFKEGFLMLKAKEAGC